MKFQALEFPEQRTAVKYSFCLSRSGLGTHEDNNTIEPNNRTVIRTNENEQVTHYKWSSNYLSFVNSERPFNIRSSAPCRVSVPTKITTPNNKSTIRTIRNELHKKLNFQYIARQLIVFNFHFLMFVSFFHTLVTMKSSKSFHTLVRPLSKVMSLRKPFFGLFETHVSIVLHTLHTCNTL